MPKLALVRDDTHTPAATAPSNVTVLPVTCHPNIARLTAAHDRATAAADQSVIIQEIHDTARALATELALPDTALARLIGAIRGGFALGYIERDAELGDPADELAKVFQLHPFGGDAS